MDRTLAKLTHDLLRWQDSQKAAYSPFKSKEISKVKDKIKLHLHTHYKFETIKQTDLGL